MSGRLALAVSSLLAVALGATTGFSAERPRVRIAVNPYVSFGPIFLAVDDGAFSALGVDVELVVYRESVLNLPPLVLGQVDAAATVITPGLLNVIARGAPVRVVAGRESYDPAQGCVYQGFALSPALAAAGAARDPSLLVGRRASVRRESLYGYMLARVLAPAGATLDDIVFLELQPPVEAEALGSGRVDFASTAEPWMTRALSVDGVRSAYAAHEVLPGFQPGLLLFGERLLTRDRALGRRVLAGYLDGVRRFREGKTGRNLEILSRRLGIPREELARVCWPSVDPRGEIRTEGLGDYQRWLSARGLLDRTIDPAELADPMLSELVRDAAAEAP